MNKKFIGASCLALGLVFTQNTKAETNTYDDQGRVTKTVHDDGSYTTYTYHSELGKVTGKYTYDAHGLPTSQLFYSYNEQGDLMMKGIDLRFNNNTVRDVTYLYYDSQGVISGGSHGFEDPINNIHNYGEVTITRDGDGNVVSATVPGPVNKVYTYTYDDQGRVISLMGADGYTFYTYDDDGNRTVLSLEKGGKAMGSNDQFSNFKVYNEETGDVVFEINSAGHQYGSDSFSAGEDIIYVYDYDYSHSSSGVKAETMSAYSLADGKLMEQVRYEDGQLVAHTYSYDGRNNQTDFVNGKCVGKVTLGGIDFPCERKTSYTPKEAAEVTSDGSNNELILYLK